MISGLTMQLLNHSRAASGAEHLMAHLVEMKPPRFENAHGMHGQCVGVGTYLCAKEYHYLASLPTPKAKPFEPLTRAWVDEKFGSLADGIMKENENDVLGTFDPQNIVDHWDEIRAPRPRSWLRCARSSARSTSRSRSASIRPCRRICSAFRRRSATA